jgi:hypothetical protein
VKVERDFCKFLSQHLPAWLGEAGMPMCSEVDELSDKAPIIN